MCDIRGEVERRRRASDSSHSLEEHPHEARVRPDVRVAAPRSGRPRADHRRDTSDCVRGRLGFCSPHIGVGVGVGCCRSQVGCGHTGFGLHMIASSFPPHSRTRLHGCKDCAGKAAPHRGVGVGVGVGWSPLEVARIVGGSVWSSSCRSPSGHFGLCDGASRFFRLTWGLASESRRARSKSSRLRSQLVRAHCT